MSQRSQFDRTLIIIAACIFGIFVFATKTHCQVLPQPSVKSKNDNSDLTVGTHFKPNQKSVITGIRYWRDENFTGTTVGHIWQDGRIIQSKTFPAGIGWINLTFDQPILADSGKNYTVGYCNDGGYYTWQEFFWQSPKRFTLWTGTNGGYSYFRNTYPNLSWNFSCYFVEPILQKFIEPVKCDTVKIVIRDTVRLVIRDTVKLVVRDTVKLVVRDTIRIRDTVLAPVLCPDTTWVFADAYDTIGARFPDYKIYGQFEFITPPGKNIRFVRRIEAIWRREEFINGQWVEK
jgi:hypothetical protein